MWYQWELHDWSELNASWFPTYYLKHHCRNMFIIVLMKNEIGGSVIDIEITTAYKNHV